MYVVAYVIAYVIARAIVYVIAHAIVVYLKSPRRKRETSEKLTNLNEMYRRVPKFASPEHEQN